MTVRHVIAYFILAALAAIAIAAWLRSRRRPKHMHEHIDITSSDGD